MATKVNSDKSLYTAESPMEVSRAPLDTLEARVTARAQRSLSVSSDDVLPPCSQSAAIATTEQVGCHFALVNIISAVYKREVLGVCRGTALTGVEAVLAGKIPAFNRNFNYLNQLFNEHKDNIDAIVEEVKANPVLLNFLDKIELCQDPVRYCSVFELEPSSQADAKIVDSLLSMIESTALKCKGGMHSIATFSGVYEPRELFLYLNNFRKVCEKSSPDAPVAILLSNLNHAVAIAYDTQTKNWLFIDANQLPVKTTQSDLGVVCYILFGLAGFNKVVIMTSEIIALKEKSETLNEGLTTWFDSHMFKWLHQITSKKAHAVDAGNGSWLHIALLRGDVTAAKSLLAAGADVNLRYSNGINPLYAALSNGHLEVALALLERGANPNLTPPEHRTPLRLALSKGWLEITKALLAKGADPDVVGTEGWTALSVASCMGCLEAVQALLAAKANPNQKTLSGESPLFIASREGHLEIIKALLDAGANPSSGDLSVAIAHGHSEIHSILEDALIKARLVERADHYKILEALMNVGLGVKGHTDANVDPIKVVDKTTEDDSNPTTAKVLSESDLEDALIKARLVERADHYKILEALMNVGLGVKGHTDANVDPIKVVDKTTEDDSNPTTAKVLSESDLDALY